MVFGILLSPITSALFTFIFICLRNVPIAFKDQLLKATTYRLVILLFLTSQQQPLIKMNQMFKLFLLLKAKVWWCA
ncbi:hypothetical protein DEO72_LG5g1003 [Vigna unguiculata]|uniref:Uncharacterized protein n=1 Tax=Vigna unguiculata TaxID=3917 RepID=A0A4D6LYI6_VIGUN|nr:hypothetical protein DEO72_LG5g1003 [Vigna unguiculata]